MNDIESFFQNQFLPFEPHQFGTLWRPACEEEVNTIKEQLLNDEAEMTPQRIDQSATQSKWFRRCLLGLRVGGFAFAVGGGA